MVSALREERSISAHFVNECFCEVQGFLRGLGHLFVFRAFRAVFVEVQARPNILLVLTREQDVPASFHVVQPLFSVCVESRAFKGLDYRVAFLD